MSSYLLKVIVIFVISAVGAGVHLGASWPVQLKAAPDAPPVWTPQQDSEAAGATEDAATEGGSSETPEPTTQTEAGETPAADGEEPFVLDTLEISLDQTRWLHEQGMATFVDARIAAEFEAGHIEGAMHISPAMLEGNSSLFVLDVIDPGKPIVIYCGGGDCDDSHRVAEMLQDLRGLTQTHVFVDGFPTWADAGLPTSTGPDPWAE